MLFNRERGLMEEYNRTLESLVKRIEDSEFFVVLKEHFHAGALYQVSVMKERLNATSSLYAGAGNDVKTSAVKRGFQVFDDRIDEYQQTNDSYRVGWRIRYADIGYAPLTGRLEVEALTAALERAFPDYHVKNYVTTQTCHSRFLPNQENPLPRLKERCREDPIHFKMKNSGGLYYFYEYTACLLLPKADYIEKTVDRMLAEYQSENQQHLKRPF